MDRSAMILCMMLSLGALGGKVAHAQGPLPVSTLRDATERGRYLATWSSDTLYLSDDRGRTFRTVAGGPGLVWDASIAPDGSLWVLRGERLGHLRRGRIRWYPLPPGVSARGWSLAEWVSRCWSRGCSDIDPGPELPRLVTGDDRIVIAVPVPEGAPVPAAVRRLEHPPTLVRLYTAAAGGGPWRDGRVEATVHSPSTGLSDGIRRAWSDRRGRLHLELSWGQGLACAVRYTTHYVGDPTARMHAVREREDDETYSDAPGLRHGNCTDGAPGSCLSVTETGLRRRVANTWQPLRPRLVGP